MSNQKSLNIELLRCLAVISVILIHMTMGHFYDALLMHENKLSWIVSNLYYSLTRFCVPIFFIISAYLVFNNKSNKKWHERLVRLGLPFVAWSAIYYVYGGGRDASEFLKKY
jgi:surface polysaccharide O-acyltransferase-like enzyme